MAWVHCCNECGVREGHASFQMHDSQSQGTSRVYLMQDAILKTGGSTRKRAAVVASLEDVAQSVSKRPRDEQPRDQAAPASRKRSSAAAGLENKAQPSSKKARDQPASYQQHPQAAPACRKRSAAAAGLEDQAQPSSKKSRDYLASHQQHPQAAPAFKKRSAAAAGLENTSQPSSKKPRDEPAPHQQHFEAAPPPTSALFLSDWARQHPAVTEVSCPLSLICIEYLVLLILVALRCMPYAHSHRRPLLARLWGQTACACRKDCI